MTFLDLLNTTAVTYIADLGKYYWDGLEGIEGWEAISPQGEIQHFPTYREANDWRIAEIRAIA